jgi:hypothetical protein
MRQNTPILLHNIPGERRMLSKKTIMIGVGVLVVAGILGNMGKKSSTPTAAAGSSSASSGVSRAEQRIKADIEATKKEGTLPADRLAEQESFAAKALDALHCAHGSIPCDIYTLESHLKGLPIGWVEKALGQPEGHQKIGGEEFSYWTVRLQEDKSSRTYKLQLQYTTPSGDCPRSITGGHVACKFNFFG